MQQRASCRASRVREAKALGEAFNPGMRGGHAIAESSSPSGTQLLNVTPPAPAEGCDWRSSHSKVVVVSMTNTIQRFSLSSPMVT